MEKSVDGYATATDEEVAQAYQEKFAQWRVKTVQEMRKNMLQMKIFKKNCDSVQCGRRNFNISKGIGCPYVFSCSRHESHK